MGRLTTRERRRSSPVLILLSIGMVLASVMLFIVELINFTQRENALPQGISVAGVRVGGLFPNQAQALWEQAYSEPITLIYGDAPPIIFSPDAIGFRINSATLLASAIASSEAEGGFWARFFSYLLGQENITLRDIPLVADYQRNVLRTYLENDIAARYDQPAGRAGYDVVSLTTFAGVSGSELDVDEAMQAIDDALRRPNNRTVQLPISSGAFAQPSLNTLRDLIIAYLDAQGFIYEIGRAHV